MGRKKTRKKSTSKKKNIDIDLAVISMIVVSILLFVLIYGEKGSIGAILSPILGGIIGPIKYVIPIGFLALAIAITKEKKSYLITSSTLLFSLQSNLLVQLY